MAKNSEEEVNGQGCGHKPEDKEGHRRQVGAEGQKGRGQEGTTQSHPSQQR